MTPPTPEILRLIGHSFLMTFFSVRVKAHLGNLGDTLREVDMEEMLRHSDVDRDGQID